MKTLRLPLLTLAGLAVSASAEIIPFAEYNLGEQGAVIPADSSGNGRNYISAAGLNALVASSEGEIVAPGSTAFLQLGGAGFFNANFSDLPSENFAVGIYARASANPVLAGTLEQHVLQTGDRAQANIRISLAANGWEASFQPVDNIPGAAISIGTAGGEPGSFVPDEWVHLAVISTLVQTGTVEDPIFTQETSFYIDGVVQGAPETTVTPVHGANAHLGINSGNTNNFGGDIDAMRVVTFTPEDEDAESIIAALQGVDSDEDGLFDDLEQRIIDAIPDDDIVSLADVNPEDDFDGDGLSNLAEQNGASDPTDPNDPPPPLSTDLELIAYWDFNDPSEFDDEQLIGESFDLVAGYGLVLFESFFSEDGEGFSGNAGDRALDFTVLFDPNDPEFELAPEAVVDSTATLDDEFFAAINSTTGDDRMVVSFWQRLFVIQNSSAFWFQSGDIAGNRGMQAHTPFGQNELFFDHLVGGGNNRLRGFAPDGGDPLAPVPFDFLPYRHYLYVKDQDTKQVFVDGNLILSAENGAGFSTDMITLNVGSQPGGNLPINGFIDDFAIFNLKPSDAQIAALAAGVSPIDVLDIVEEPPAVGFLITEIGFDGATVTLTFTSNEGETYRITSSLDLTSFENEVVTGITAEPGSATTTVTIDISTTGLQDEDRVFFRVEEVVGEVTAQ